MKSLKQIVYLYRNELPGLCGMVTINHSENDDFNTLPSVEVTQVLPAQDMTDNGKRFFS